MIDTKKVLALDLATNTGFARNYGPEPRTGSVSFEAPKPSKKLGIGKAHVGHVIAEFDTWLSTNYADEMRPDFLVLEEPHMRGGAPTKMGVGLWAIAVASACNGEVPVMCVRTRDLKISFTGIGNASKDDMIAMARRRGYDPKDDDEADACLLLEYMLELKGLKTKEQ